MADQKISDLSSGTISGTQLLFNGNPSTGELKKNTFAELQTFLGLPNIYATNLTQSSTSAPTASTPVNNIGTTITFSRTSAGAYHATAGTAVFTANKTFVFLTNVFDTALIEAKVVSTTVIDFDTRNAGTFAGQDDLLDGNSFKIEIYP